MRRTLAIAVAALLLLAGCAGAPAATEPDPDSPLASIGLVNLWRVSGAADAGDEVYLRLGAHDLFVWSDCGVGTGSWRGGDSAFVGDVSMGSGGAGCLPDPETRQPVESLAWLAAARAFRPAGDGFELLDGDGDVVATLSVDGTPPANSGFGPEYTRAPEMTAEVTAAFARTERLEGTVADADSLVGRWEAMGAPAFDPPYIDFAADGSWEGSDGCNGTTGRWLLDTEGGWFGTSGAWTERGCGGNPVVAEWVSGASSVTLADDELTFVDASGATLGSLAR